MSAGRAKSKTLSLRLSDETHERLLRATTLGPYALSYTAVIERGIVLVERELEQMAKDAKP